MLNRLQSFVYGLLLPYHSAKLILTHGKLLLWSLLPIGITFLLYGFVISGIQEWAQALLLEYINSLGINPEHWMAGIVIFAGNVFFWIIAALIFAFLSSIIASPFNDTLAEKTEPLASPPLPEVSAQPLKMKLKLMVIDVIKAMSSGFASIFVILLCWVPVLNLISLVIAFLLVTFQYISYPQNRRGVGLSKGAGFLLRYVFACSGFGASISFFLALPFISSFALPVAVVGGTLLVARAQTKEGFALK